MELVHDIFFLDSLTFKLWKKCVTNITNVLHIIFKKNAEHGHLSIVARVQIIVFPILCFYFEVVFHGIGA